MRLRSIAEPASIALIGLGLVMLMQPWALVLYTYSFVVLLAGVAGYSIALKLPEAGEAGESSEAGER